MQGILYGDTYFLQFFFISIILGGGAAWMTGRACAQVWNSIWLALFYMLPLGFAVRFIHYAVVAAPFLSLQYFIVDMIILVVFCLIGYRFTRVRQLVRQYSWLYEKTSPLTVRKKADSVQAV